MAAIDVLRSALLISLPILLVAVLWKRFKQRVMARDLPSPSHAELVGLEVAYHPSRVRALVKIPAAELGFAVQEIRTALLDEHYQTVHRWTDERLLEGEHWIERPLVDHADGLYFFEMSTATQRTVRQFRLQQAVLPYAAGKPA